MAEKPSVQKADHTPTAEVYIDMVKQHMSASMEIGDTIGLATLVGY